MIRSCDDLKKTVQDMGFLPFFKNGIEGFSIEEMTPASLWFSDECDGPWEWKGPVIREGNCAYGKLFRGKAGYVSLDWYPEFLNFRRAGYHPTEKEQQIYNLLVASDSLLSKELKKAGGFKRTIVRSHNPIDNLIKTPVIRQKNNEGFETIMTRLQMRCYVVIADFEYQYTHDGKRYGWGIARYTTPEALFGEDVTGQCAKHTPEESKERLLQHLAGLLPHATEGELMKFLLP